VFYAIIIVKPIGGLMATQVYEVVEIELADGTKLQLRPLKIKLLREFMKTFSSGASQANIDDSDSSMDLLIDCVEIAMKQYKPDMASKEVLEDVLDLPTIYKIIEVASGIKLNDPNLMAAAGLVGTN
jgi:hypothetical protein